MLKFKILLLSYCLLCNVGLRHQNLSHLNKTHKKEKIIEKKIFKIQKNIFLVLFVLFKWLRFWCLGSTLHNKQYNFTTFNQKRGVGIVPEQVHRGGRHRQVLHIQHAVQPSRNLPASMHHRLLYKQRRKLWEGENLMLS